MTTQFSPKLSEILAYSREEAARLASRSVGPEHLLLGILRTNDGPVIDLFRQLDVNLSAVKVELEALVRQDEITTPVLATDLTLNEQANNVLRLAVLEARIQRATSIDEQHLLLAILHDMAKNGAKQVLELNNMTYDDTLNRLFAPKNTNVSNGVTNGIGLPDEEEEEYEQTGGAKGASSNQQGTTTTQKKPNSKTPVLDSFEFGFFCVEIGRAHV